MSRKYNIQNLVGNHGNGVEKKKGGITNEVLVSNLVI